MARDTAHTGNAPSGHTGEQEPSGPGHRTSNSTHQAGTPVNKSQVAQGSAHATQHAEGAHCWTGAKWPRTPHTRATHRGGTPVNRSQGAQDTAQAKQHTERAYRGTGAKLPRTLHTQNNTPSRRTGEQEPSGPGHRTSKATHRAGTPVNRSQVPQDAAQAKQRTKQAHR